jgi:serine/threonine protein kinase
MTTEPQEIASVNSNDIEPVPPPPEPEHQYRFKDGGQIADRYKVISSLGFGGFSEVYHCHDVRLDREVAVKVLTEKGLGLEEARTAARLKHPRIVHVYEMLTPEGEMPVIVFDYVEGETLEARLNKVQYGRLALNGQTLSIISQVSEALDYAHELGVVHQDIKPSNIILGRKGNAYLTDFGLAEVKRRTEGKGEAEREGKAERESMLSVEIQERLSGTIPYMAPEQLAEGKPGDRRSDLYSLGVVVYEMLTGQLPYRGRGPSLIYRIATSEPIPPTQANSELPLGVESVLLRALDRNPEKRYPSCLAFAQELEQAAEAYVVANDQYEQAREHFAAKRWRQALDTFKSLEIQAPGFKDATHYLEQARHQVRLLELYEQVQSNLKEEKYQDALETLNILSQLDSEYDVGDLRQQAHEGLAAKHYQQAVQQFGKGEYEACLATLDMIHEWNPDHPDPEEIEVSAREQVERQQKIHELDTKGVEETHQEKWEEAIATFEELQREAPDHKDVENQLAIARHMARMFSFLEEARGSLKQDAFADCVDKLEELRQVDVNYKQDEVTQMRQEALNRLHERAHRLLREKKFEESLAALAELRVRSSDYPDVGELEAQAQEGIRVRDLRVKLDGLYGQAVEQLNRRAYAEALELWQAIQHQKGDLDYADPRDVGVRARDGLCMNLYNQALGDLNQRNPEQALELWHQVREVDPDYPDGQGVEERAQALIERVKKTRWWAIRLGGGGIALILLVILVAAILRACGGEVVPPTDTPTRTPSLATMPPLTPSPTLTPTWTASPTATVALAVTLTPTPTPTPTATLPAPATAIQGSSIYAAPASNSQVLGGISVGERVPVLGRSAVGQWFYVRDDQGVEGFVYAPRFGWPGDYESLPVVASPVTPPPTVYTTPSGPPYPALEMDLWDISGRCSGGKWYKSVYIQGHGGNGVYTYYWNGKRVAGPTSEDYSFEVESMGGAMIGTGKVVSGDGQVVERKLYIRAPDCAR